MLSVAANGTYELSTSFSKRNSDAILAILVSCLPIPKKPRHTGCTTGLPRANWRMRRLALSSASSAWRCMKIVWSYIIEIILKYHLMSFAAVMKCHEMCLSISILHRSFEELKELFAMTAFLWVRNKIIGTLRWLLRLGASHGASSANNGWKWMNGSHRTVGCSCLWMFATSMRLFFLPCAIVGLSASFVKSHEWKSNIQLRVSGT